MFPLQVGNTDTLFVVVIGVVFFAIIVVLIVYGVRRSTRMSDELSKEWEEKVRAIKQTTPVPKEPQTKEKQPPPPPKDDQVRDLASQSTLQAELRDYKTELQRCLQEIATLRDNETSMRSEIVSLRTEISTLQERVLNSREEIQELSTSIEQTVKPQITTLTRDVQVETNMRKEIEGVRTEISTLQERLVNSREEIEKLRTSIEESAKPQITTQTRYIQPQTTQEPEPAARQPKRGGWSTRIFGGNPPSRACPNCKRTLRAQDRYCDHCGQEAQPSI